jgi:hypothetical protein
MKEKKKKQNFCDMRLKNIHAINEEKKKSGKKTHSKSIFRDSSECCTNKNKRKLGSLYIGLCPPSNKVGKKTAITFHSRLERAFFGFCELKFFLFLYKRSAGET